MTFPRLNAPSQAGSRRQLRSRHLVALLPVLGISLGLVATGGPQANAARDAGTMVSAARAMAGQSPGGIAPGDSPGHLGPTTGPTPLPNPSCSASYTQIQFPGTGYGFEATVDVTNTGTTALTGWTVTFTFPGNQWILHYWHALVTQSRENITAINASDNGLLGAGETTAFGLLGDYFDAGPVSLTCTPEPWQVSLTGSSYVAPGYAGTFTATTNNDVGPTSYDIQIWDVTTGTEVALCGRGTTCSATYTTNYDAAEDQIVAYIAENSTGTVPLGTAQASSNTVLVYNDV